MESTTQPLIIPYNICFLFMGEKVLLLNRQKPPHQYLWNGVGGKLEKNETPEASLWREVMEETGINIQEAAEIYYAGIVTWMGWKGTEHTAKELYGMYAYVVTLQNGTVSWQTQETREGKLEWKSKDWVLQKGNPEIAENIPYFLPRMLQRQGPKRFHCDYEGQKLINFTELPLVI